MRYLCQPLSSPRKAPRHPYEAPRHPYAKLRVIPCVAGNLSRVGEQKDFPCCEVGLPLRGNDMVPCCEVGLPLRDNDMVPCCEVGLPLRGNDRGTG